MGGKQSDKWTSDIEMLFVSISQIRIWRNLMSLNFITMEMIAIINYMLIRSDIWADRYILEKNKTAKVRFGGKIS